ncbi:hypothetical protein [Ensifer sp.]|jgi:hypothetical protein|uniref:hypothetical protein n=1 Tax=Ensifer sp. TaxID=1872086 RepID=UPI002E0FBF35|nr:hypothetical protein [Ensifer sp.]
MAGFVVTVSNVTFCLHAGTATALPAPQSRLFASAMPVVTLANSYVIAGCQFPTMTSGAQPPCVKGRFAAGATRVFSMGFPVATVASLTACDPLQTPMIVAPAGQARVVAL